MLLCSLINASGPPGNELLAQLPTHDGSERLHLHSDEVVEVSAAAGKRLLDRRNFTDDSEGEEGVPLFRELTKEEEADVVMTPAVGWPTIPT